jgi:hypothetical protein
MIERPGADEEPKPRILSVEEITSPLVLLLHGHWQALRAGREFPAKSNIDPAELKQALPYLILSEIHRDPLRVRYRLVGTRVALFSRDDFTGRWLHETKWSDHIKRQVLEIYELALKQRCPLYGRDWTIWNPNRWAPFEWAMFPLADDGIAISHFIGVEDYSQVDQVALANMLDDDRERRGV